MKVLIFVAILLSIVIVAILNISLTPKSVPSKNQNFPTPTEALYQQDLIEIEYKGQKLVIAFSKVPSPSKLFLYPNFKDKISSKDAKQTYQCKNLVSGGFYTKEDAPVGLFISNGSMTRDKTASDLFNGIFWIDFGDKIQIDTSYPRGSSRIAIQSGPILIKNDLVQKLSIKNDETDRRIAVAITNDNKIVFLAIYEKQKVLQGPFLVDLPQIVKEFEKNSNIIIKDALNLDGGSASTFYHDNVTLNELSSVGSFFCEK